MTSYLFFCTHASSEKGSTLKGKNLLESKFFLFRVQPFQKGQTFLTEWNSPECVSVHLKTV